MQTHLIRVRLTSLKQITKKKRGLQGVYRGKEGVPGMYMNISYAECRFNNGEHAHRRLRVKRISLSKHAHRRLLLKRRSLRNEKDRKMVRTPSFFHRLRKRIKSYRREERKKKRKQGLNRNKETESKKRQKWNMC